MVEDSIVHENDATKQLPIVIKEIENMYRVSIE